MPLFRASGDHAAKPRPKCEKTGRSRVTDEDVSSLTRLCLLSLADNMKAVWAEDYASNYLDHYCFSYIMGPFNFLSGNLVEELLELLCTRKQLSRAALHLLLLPQLRNLSLDSYPSLVTSSLCAHIAARCQALHSLSLSGAQYLGSKALCDTLPRLPALRSLSLAGTPCNADVIRTAALCCPLLRHLDVSRCCFLPPSALLLLAGFRPLSYSASSATSGSPLPLWSLLALDIALGDAQAVAAYLVLALPRLQRVALEGLSQACSMIHERSFAQADEFSGREGLPRLEEVWRKRSGDAGEDGWMLLDASESEGEAVTSSYSPASDEHPTLCLSDVQVVTCDSLVILGRLCPNISSLSVNMEEENGGRPQASVFATGLRSWSGQLRRLSVQHQGPLLDLLPALRVAGSTLVSLTLEGVKTSPRCPLLEMIRVCPRLEELLVCAEPPEDALEDEDDVVELDQRDLPSLPSLRSLALSFSFEHNHTKPIMSWMSLATVIRCLLAAAPLLEKLSLVSLPCPLNHTLQLVLGLSPSAPKALGRLQRLNLQWTNVEMATVTNIIQRSKRLKYVDVSHCWEIRHKEWLYCRKLSTVQIVRM
ncbi:uncharacterized protein [Nerophis lumbriciformis]|uniref:uncharacterized protein n=1 Tax=Nerophis lumbriciformis TaxID=546530 RepID=UPI002ADFC1A9|nr:uncharacterized protein si:ch211-214j8.12 [Nerophis lumbriciformis]